MKLLITAGPTREPIDAVRFIGNRSSGKLGVALAQAAKEMGHEVTLLLGPCMATPPKGVMVERFESVADLEALLGVHFPRHDVLIMAAAVSDYRPIQRHNGKLPRDARGRLVLELEATPDLVSAVTRLKTPGQRVIAFALEEPEAMEQRAAEKLRTKGVDAIVANPLTTMESDAITPTWIAASGERLSPGPMAKTDFARWLVEAAVLLV